MALLQDAINRSCFNAINMQIFTANGSYLPSAKTIWIKVEIQAGGGGSTSAALSNSSVGGNGTSGIIIITEYIG